MSIPRATVRLQLHPSFTFDDARATIDYYAALGISHFYLSPIFAAREGSTHGYDVIDPARINPQLGGEPGFLALVSALRARGMGVVIDVVPNHMGVAPGANPYWEDVLLWGRKSRFSHWFDIDWDVANPRLNGKLLLPVLGEPLDAVLAAGQLRLAINTDAGRLTLAYHDNIMPLSTCSQADVLGTEPSLQDLAERFKSASADSLPAVQQAFSGWLADSQGLADAERAIGRHDPASIAGRSRLLAVLDQQHYRLSWWRNAAEEINWRRFFEVSELAGVRVELDDVFEATHVLVFDLYARGLIDGVRIDHVDGLADPRAYCVRLRQRLCGLQAQRPAPLDSTPAWIVLEKILSPGEELPPDWPVDGTTGYDFMDQVGALLSDAGGEKTLREHWATATGDRRHLDEQVQVAREQLLAENFGGELEALAQALHAYAGSFPAAGRDLSLAAIRRVLTSLLAACRRYRTYATGSGMDDGDRRVLEEVSATARRKLHAPDHALLDEMTSWLAGEKAGADSSLRARAVTRFQQLTPPLAAKSVEDTAFYRYGPLLSRNEVGSWPAGDDDDDQAVNIFHQHNLRRASNWPHSMLATATHDHKRGEDVRARLAGLGEMPERWIDILTSWRSAHAASRYDLDLHGTQITAPTPADEIMLYQMLLGAWPPGLATGDEDGIKAFAERISGWQEKALREAKLHTSWMLPQAGYEDACHQFLMDLLQGPGRPVFLAELTALVTRLERPALINSLSQTLLRLTSPGVPDLYQGTELADFSLVDPDNRRPVDLDARRSSLHAFGDRAAPVTAPGYQLKQLLMHRVLRVRRHRPAMFEKGGYVPLEVPGPIGKHLVAFARRDGEEGAITLAARRPLQLLQALDDGVLTWDSLTLRAPDTDTHHWLARNNWEDALTGVQMTGDTLPALESLLDAMPLALFIRNGT